jgi:hypothetical protein
MPDVATACGGAGEVISAPLLRVFREIVAISRILYPGHVFGLSLACSVTAKRKAPCGIHTALAGLGKASLLYKTIDKDIA